MPRRARLTDHLPSRIALRQTPQAVPGGLVVIEQEQADLPLSRDWLVGWRDTHTGWPQKKSCRLLGGWVRR